VGAVSQAVSTVTVESADESKVISIGAKMALRPQSMRLLSSRLMFFKNLKHPAQTARRTRRLRRRKAVQIRTAFGNFRWTMILRDQCFVAAIDRSRAVPEEVSCETGEGHGSTMGDGAGGGRRRYVADAGP